MVEISYGAETVLKDRVSGRSKLAGGEWWATIKGQPTVSVRERLILERSQTPFVLANYSDFEMPIQ